MRIPHNRDRLPNPRTPKTTNKGKSKWHVTLPCTDARTHGLYKRYDRQDRIIVAGFYVRGYDKAEALAKELFGETARVDQFSLGKGYNTNSWTGIFWTKNSQYGVYYCCMVCGKDQKGRDNPKYHHWPDCPYAPEASHVPDCVCDDKGHDPDCWR